jgi:hypothetical protein
VGHKFALPGARTLYRVVDAVEQVLPALGIAQPQSAPLRVAQGD